jgi:predicted nucleic acid-binding Zn ribbon protein
MSNPCGWCGTNVDEEEIFCSLECETTWYSQLNESEYDYGE